MLAGRRVLVGLGSWWVKKMDKKRLKEVRHHIDRKWCPRIVEPYVSPFQRVG
jgi:hypothetical protein